MVRDCRFIVNLIATAVYPVAQPGLAGLTWLGRLHSYLFPHLPYQSMLLPIWQEVGSGFLIIAMFLCIIAMSAPLYGDGPCHAV